MKVLLPASVPMPGLRLPDGVVPVTYDTKAPVPVEHEDADVLVTFELRPRLLRESAPRMRNLRLVQTLTAGTDAAESAGFGDDVTICSGVGLHNIPAAEHALMLSLALVRRLPASMRAQSDSRWARELGGTQPLFPEGEPVTSLYKANVTIWGFGNIGQHLAGLLTPLGANVTGVARTVGQRSGFPVITDAQLPDVLPSTDVLVMVLPGNDATHLALDAERLALLPETAYVVNIGRGTSVDETALEAALRDGTIAGAALDVTQTEPLPEDSPLWSAPNLIITPHAASGRPVNPGALVEHNLRALVDGGELRNRVDR